MNENTIIDEKLLAENSDFLNAVVGAKTVEEAENICAEYHVELPEDMWKDIHNSYSEGKLDAGELGEDELDAVSGGRKLNGNYFLKTLAGVVGLGAVVAAGSAAGVLVACAWIGYNAYRTFR